MSGSLPVGRKLYCYACRKHFRIKENHPGAHTHKDTEEKTFPRLVEENEIIRTYERSSSLWLIPCPDCGYTANTYDHGFKSDPRAIKTRLAMLRIGHPCPKCGKGLASERALQWPHCRFNWFKCPSCDSDWERGSDTCKSCKESIERLAEKNPG